MSENENNQPARYEHYIGLAGLSVLVVGCFIVMRPFISALIWSIILSYCIWPLHKRLVGWLKGRRSLAAFLIVMAFAAALVAPLTATVANLTDDARDLVAAGRHWIQDGLPASPAWVGKVPVVGARATRAWNDLGQEVATLVAEGRARSRLRSRAAWRLGAA